MKSKTLKLALILLIPGITLAQGNGTTGSPYSLFGLGIESNASIGKNSSLGGGGYALSGNNFINNLNPASYANFGTNTFLYDVGVSAEISNIANRSADERRFAGSISNLALAGSITPKSGFGIAIIPFTDVGYSLLGVESNIEGATDTFVSNIFGSGSLNDLKLVYGHRILKNISIGGSLSYLFGSIEEREQINTGSSGLTVLEDNRYTGTRLGFGVQYDFYNKLTFGFAINFPTFLSGKQDRTVQRTLENTLPGLVDNEKDIPLSNFKLPIELNQGIFFKAKENLSLNIDYGIKLWGSTNQTDNIGKYIDQYIFAAGAEYYIDDRGIKPWHRLRFRAGFNYDTGYLEIRDTNIESYQFTAGIGIPIGPGRGSNINISFARGNRGSIGGLLVEESFNTININFSLKDIWFVKRKIN
ncbi:hypothetical protein [Croceitalea rosinachiae]|uniref:Long-chain fatty acid transport protein n=1 Tax=Croceitalea rosinachiae TaxID=3075596 RepID=A0ABU3A9C8_9FLAO|nr:hypothetical protein [Croceitalea sp. F388]MDT0606802.1 hypothetical protein [Croceitalea sp. F388]